MKANEKILRQIKNRTQARGQAGDVDGLQAIIEACEQGLKHAEETLQVLIPAHAKKQQEKQDKYEGKLKRQMESAEASALYKAIMDMGGIKASSQDVLEEYRNVPPSYRRRDGMPGDEIAEHLMSNHPQFGITDENSLLEYFANRATKRRNERAI